jgi:hypothetical protein
MQNNTNSVANYVMITGKPITIKDFWNKATTSSCIEKNGIFCYDNLYPTPDKEYWYVWRTKHWGNKYGCFNVLPDISSIKDGIIKIFYNTALSCSAAFWKKITTKFDIEVVNYFYDEYSYFCGKHIYYGGKIIFEKMYNDFKIQKVKFIEYAEICNRHGYFDNDPI